MPLGNYKNDGSSADCDFDYKRNLNLEPNLSTIVRFFVRAIHLNQEVVRILREDAVTLQGSKSVSEQRSQAVPRRPPHLRFTSNYLRCIKKTNSVPVCTCDSSALPVCLAKAWKSRTEPGSVAMMRSTSPLCSSANAFFAFRIGKGQFKPRASSSL